MGAHEGESSFLYLGNFCSRLQFGFPLGSVDFCCGGIVQIGGGGDMIRDFFLAPHVWIRWVWFYFNASIFCCKEKCKSKMNHRLGLLGGFCICYFTWRWTTICCFVDFYLLSIVHIKMVYLEYVASEIIFLSTVDTCRHFIAISMLCDIWAKSIA